MNKMIANICLLIHGFLVGVVALSQVSGVEAVGMTVKDMERSLHFYTEVLSFKKLSDTEYKGAAFEKLQGIFGLNTRVVRLQLGDEVIELTDYLTAGGRSIPEDAKSNDLFFQHIAIVVSDMDKAYQHLRKFNVEHVSTSPQTLPESIPAAAGIKAFYFHDPDNHNLELIYFPEDKGLEKWHSTGYRKDGEIFLGIDHTAIGVSRTENSHHFYSDILGMERKGDSWNKGSEQEHLNNVEGASLHITGYRATAGPGIEFLEYLFPGPGKPYPADSHADDIWYWQTTLVVNDASILYDRLVAAGYSVISRELVYQQTGDAYTRSFLVRDPDGHAVLIREYLNR